MFKSIYFLLILFSMFIISCGEDDKTVTPDKKEFKILGIAPLDARAGDTIEIATTVPLEPITLPEITFYGALPVAPVDYGTVAGEKVQVIFRVKVPPDAQSGKITVTLSGKSVLSYDIFELIQ